MSAFGKYIQETKVELKHVAWPTQMQTIVYTALVIGISIAVALMIGFFDFFFSRGVETILSTAPGKHTTPAVEVTPVSTSTSPASGAESGQPIQFNVLPTNTK